MALDNSVKFKVNAEGYQALSSTSPTGISWTLGYCVPIYDESFDVRILGYTNVSDVDFLKENGITHLEWWNQYETVDTVGVSAFVGEKIWLRGSYDSTGRYVRANGYELTGAVRNDPAGLLNQSRLVSEVLPTHCWQVKPYSPIAATATSGAATAGVYEAVIPSDSGDFVFNKMAVFIKELNANGTETGVIKFFGMVYSNVNLAKRFFGYGSVVNMTLKLNVVVRSNVTSYDDYVFFSDGYWKMITPQTIGVGLNTVSGSTDVEYGYLFNRAIHTTIMETYETGRFNELILTPDTSGLHEIGLGILASSNSYDVGFHNPLGTTGTEYVDDNFTVFLSPLYLTKTGNDYFNNPHAGNFVFGRPHKASYIDSPYREVSGDGNVVFDLLSGAGGIYGALAPSVLITSFGGVKPRNNLVYGGAQSVGGFGNLSFGQGVEVGSTDQTYGSITHATFSLNFGNMNRVGQYGFNDNGTLIDFDTSFSIAVGLTNDVVHTDFASVWGHCNKTTVSVSHISGVKNDVLGLAWLDAGSDLLNIAHHSGTDVPSATVGTWTPQREGVYVFGHHNFVYSSQTRDSGSSYYSTDSFYDIAVFGHRNRVGISGSYVNSTLVSGDEMNVLVGKAGALFGRTGYVGFFDSAITNLAESTVSAIQFGVSVGSSSYESSNWHSVNAMDHSSASSNYSLLNARYLNVFGYSSDLITGMGFTGTGIRRNQVIFGSDHNVESTIDGDKVVKYINGTGSSPVSIFKETSVASGGGATGMSLFDCANLIALPAIKAVEPLGTVNIGGGLGRIYFLYNRQNQTPMYAKTGSDPAPENNTSARSDVYIRETAMPNLRGTWDGELLAMNDNGTVRHLYMYLPLLDSIGSTSFRGRLVRVVNVGSTFTITGTTYRKITYADARTLNVAHQINYNQPYRVVQSTVAFAEIVPEGIDFLLKEPQIGLTTWWDINPNSITCPTNEEPKFLESAPEFINFTGVLSNTRTNGMTNSAVNTENSVLMNVLDSSIYGTEIYGNFIAHSRISGYGIEFVNKNPGYMDAKTYLAEPMASSDLGQRWHFQTEIEDTVHNKYGTYDTIFTEVLGSDIHFNYGRDINGSLGIGHSAYNRWFGHKLYIGHDFYDGSLGTTGIMFTDIFGLDIAVLSRNSGNGNEVRYANHNLFARGIHMLVTRNDQYVMGKLNKGSIYNVFEFGFGQYAYNDSNWWNRANAISVGYIHTGLGYYTGGDYHIKGNSYEAADLAFKVDCGKILLGDEDHPEKNGLIIRKFTAYSGQVAPVNAGAGNPTGLWAAPLYPGRLVMLINSGDPTVYDLTNCPDLTSNGTVKDENCLAISIPTPNVGGGVTTADDLKHVSKVIGVALSSPIDGKVTVAFGGGPLYVQPHVTGTDESWLSLPSNFKLISKDYGLAGYGYKIFIG